MSNSKNMPFSVPMYINAKGKEGDPALQAQQDECFSIAMIGNFGGSKAKLNISDRSFIEIDRFNFDETLSSLAPLLSFPMGKSGSVSHPDSSYNNVNIDLSPKSLEDFQPDNLYEQIDVFSQLRDLRKRLNNSATFKQAMQEMDLPEDVTTQEQPGEQESLTQPKTDEPLPTVSNTSLLDSIMDETAGQLEQSTDRTPPAIDSKTKSLVGMLIREAVGTRKTLSRDSRQDELVTYVDDIIAHQMRDVLHHPQFQALESLWHCVYFLVKRVRSEKAVKLYLLDVSRDELASDLAVDDVTQSQLYRQFCDNAAGDINWSLIIGDYRFGADIDDMLQLSQIGIVAQQAGAHFIAAANENLIGCDAFAEAPQASDWKNKVKPSIEEAWTLLRQSPIAKSISLALPRFLLRMPYGNKTIPVTAFAFEEMSDNPKHEDYLWGNPAFLKATQMARAFEDSGWDMNLANSMTVEDLPIHYVQQAGQTEVKPCAEISLTDTGASKMIAQGLIPLWSVKNTDRIQSGNFHSISE